MSNLSRTPVQSRNTLDPRSYDSDDNSGELALGVHVDLISRTPNHIRFDETEPERASVPNQGTAAISSIPMETINLLLEYRPMETTKLHIRAIHIDGMHHNLLSEHQVCAGGTSGQEQVGIFTSEGCRFFPLSACREALNIMSKCPSTFYGLVKGGVYVYAPHGHSK